jgi:uncharacterized protein (DUF4415 family)
MTGNKLPMDLGSVDPDEAPDLSTADWRRKLDAAPVKRGRPKSATPKISTTLRLDADVLDYFREAGPGWQSRINAVLLDWVRRGE